MIEMSFYKGTLNRELATKIITESEKPCVFTYGFAFRNPTTYRKPIDKDKALAIIKDAGYLNIKEETDVVHLNEFSGNDMW